MEPFPVQTSEVIVSLRKASQTALAARERVNCSFAAPGVNKNTVNRSAPDLIPAGRKLKKWYTLVQTKGARRLVSL
jgi:hypothetical protein